MAFKRAGFEDVAKKRAQMNKEKVPKSDRIRRPISQVSRPPARPAPQPPDTIEQQQRAPSTTTSIFGSLRHRGGVATSTPNKTEKEDSKGKTKSFFKKKDDKSESVNSTARKRIVPTVDRNDNIESLSSIPSTDNKAINPHILIRRRGKENVKQHPSRIDRKEGPGSKEVIYIGEEKDRLKTGRIKSSTGSLNNILSVQPKSTQSQQPKPKRPVTIPLPSSVSVRRGHKDGQSHQDNISRTSSVTNLESLEANLQAQQAKGAKPRKVASKERIDKQTQNGKKVTKNNNKLEPPTAQQLSYSSDSLQETEIQHLKKQLRDMSDEKSSLALQLGEQRGQLNVLQKEIQKLKSFQEDSSLEMDKLAEENTTLRNRLRDVAHSPLSDNEKHQLLFESRHHSSAPASIATNVAEDNGGDATTCTTPDWDKHSSSNISEVSVACLQDKINQMQETHYSTNEELQATLQELTDLQRQLTELQQENERLNEEKTLMFDSLCRQTERLNDSRQEVENLKQLLYRDRSDESGINQLESVVEREQKLVELLRSAQEEREQLLLKLEQIQADLQDSRSENIEKAEILAQQSERVRTLEYTLDAKHAEHRQLDQELAQAKDQCSGKQIEINRLTDLLENARTKINELEQDRTLSDKSELDELLDNARKEKDQLESEVAYLKEQLARSKNEIEKLKDQVFVLQEECKVTRNNAKTTQSDLEYKCEKLVNEKNTLGEQLQQFQEAVNELQVQAQCHLEDKRQLSAVLSETQRNLSEAERRNLNLETEIQELKKLRSEENDEWEKFQNDLLTSVRVANDFKTEAQQELQKIILENKTYREKLRLLEGQVEKLKGGKTSTSTQTDVILTPQLISLAKNLDQSIPNRLSLLEHPISSTSLNSGSPTTPTSSMDKLFPILSKERRSKSKDNLSDDLSRGSETQIRGSKSKDNLSNPGSKKSNDKIKKAEKSKEKPVTLDLPKKENRGFFQRNKSKDNLEERSLEEPSTGIMGFLRRSKTKEIPEQLPNANNSEKDQKEDSSKSGISFLKRNKSKDDLKQFAEIDNDTVKKEETSKANTSFLKRTKSKDNLDQLATIDSVDVPSTSKKDEDTTKKEAGSVDKPRKSTDSSSSSSKSDFAKPELFSKLIKKRDKKMRSHRKTMSVEEETLLKSLESWYGNIDKNIPDEYLSKEDRAVKQLKVLYEDDQLKERPVAHKPKEQLAISKPLLNSVIQNPKLDEIVRNPHVPTVETQVRESALEDTFTLVNEEHEDHTVTDAPRFRLRSEEIYTNIGPRTLGIHKCQSLDDVNVFEEYRTESELAPVLYRAVETDNLATEERVDIKALPRHESVFSEIYPNDSVSNPRYSARYYDTRVDYVPNDLPKPNIYVNYENLDEIINRVPKDVPESKLTEEQRFALKLKLALFEAEKKNTLKKINKNKKSIKGLEISEPTTESVQKNWKLKEIMLNPRIKKAEEAKKDKFFLDLFDESDKKRHSADSSYDMGEIDEIQRTSGTISKSYEDISFSFVPENTLMNLHYGKNVQHGAAGPKVASVTSSSSQSFTSAEFNLDTGKIIQKWDIPTKLNIEQQTIPQIHKADKATEDLLYNETINKEKNKRRHKQKQVSDELEYKQSLDQLKQDLLSNKSNNSTGEKNQYEEKSDLWIKGSLERYKKDLHQMVKRIDSDQLRESLRRRGLKASNFETDYQVAQTEMVVEEYKISLASPVEIYSVRRHESEEMWNNNEEEKWKVQHIDNSDSHNTTNYPDVEKAGEKILGGETIDEAVNISILYDIISEFILNERMLSEGYDPRKIHIQKRDLKEFHIKRMSIERKNSDDAKKQFHSTNVKENQPWQPSAPGVVKDIFEGTEPSHKPYKKEQSHIVEQVEHLESTFKSNRGTLDLYEISFQSPVESNSHFETSKINVLNRTSDIAELDAGEKPTNPYDFHFPNAMEVEPYKTADESINVQLLYDIISEFILRERMLSEGYNPREIDIQKRDSQEREHKLVDDGSLAAEQVKHVRSTFEPKSKEEKRGTLDLYEIRYQSPVESNTHFETSKINVLNKHDSTPDIAELDAVEKIITSPKDFHFQSPIEVEPNKIADESINVQLLYDIISEFILNEKMSSEGYNPREIDLQKWDSQERGHKLVDHGSLAAEQVKHVRTTFEPKPKEKKRGTLDLYEIRYQSPVESNTHFETSKINVLNKHDSTPDIAELDAVEKIITSPKDFHFQSPIEVEPNKIADESINVQLLYDIISEFILNEKMWSEGYNPREIDLQKWYSQERGHKLVDHGSLAAEQVKHVRTTFEPKPKEKKRGTLDLCEIRYQSPVESNTHFETSKINVLNKHDSTPDIAELDAVEKTITSPKDFHFQSPIEVQPNKTADESINVQFLYDIISEFILNEKMSSEGYNPREIDLQKWDSQERGHKLVDHGSLAAEQVKHVRSTFEPKPKEKKRGTLDLYEIRYQSPVESNTHFETSKINVLNKHYSTPDIAELDAVEKIITSPKEFHFQSPIEVEPNKIADESINVQMFYETIREFILHEKMCSEGYGVGERYIEKADSQSRNVNKMSIEADHKNDNNKRSEIFIEDIRYQLPSTSFEANTGQPELLTYQGNLYSSHLVDMPTPQSAEITKEYSYKEILKENQYGVVSPLDLRYTYRGVVKEYKEKYPPEPIGETEDDKADGSDVSDLEYNEDFIDEFFKPATSFEYGFGPNVENSDPYVPDLAVEQREIKDQEQVVLDEDVEIRRRDEAVSQIDKELQDIMEKYMHTRTSLLVKKSGIDVEEKDKNLENKSNLKKYNNFENLNEIDSSESKINNEETRALEKISSKVVLENEDIKCVELDYGEYGGDDEALSLEDLKFIEEMKARYAPTDNVSIVSDKNTGLPDISEEEIEYKFQHLTDEELDLIRSAEGDRYSRPLSDINERDLLLIDEIAKRYFHNSSLSSSVRNSLQETKQVKESNAIKDNETVISAASEMWVSVKKQDVTPPLPLSLPPMPSSEYIDRSYNYSNYEDVGDRTSPDYSEKKAVKADISDSKAVIKKAPEPSFIKSKGYKVSFASPVEVYLGSKNEAGFIQLEEIPNISKQNITSGKTLKNKTADDTINVLVLKDSTKNFIFNERKFSDGYKIRNREDIYSQHGNQNKQNTSYNPIDREFSIRFSGPADTENQIGMLNFKDHEPCGPTTDQIEDPLKLSQQKHKFGFKNKQSSVPVSHDLDDRVELRNKAVIKDDNATISKSETDTPNAIETISKSMLSPNNSYLPPSLRPKKPGALRPVSYQDNMMLKDKNTTFTSRGLLNRAILSADSSSPTRQSHRLSDLIFTETIFVPLPKDERSKIPTSPLSPGYKQEEEHGTWRYHQRPDFKETIVIPSTRKVGPFNVVGSKDMKSSAPKSSVPKSPAFRETLFIPSTANDPKERTASTTSTLGHQNNNRPGDPSFNETIIIPAKQKLTSYSLQKRTDTSKDSPNSPQSETQVTVINKPGYHSFKETIIVPALKESPEAKVQNSEELSLQKSVTQTKNSSRSEVRVNFNRYSAIQKPIVSTTAIRTSERRSSSSEPFKLKCLEESSNHSITTYEPVYSNVHFSSNTYKAVMSPGSDIKKKPLPIPRSTESIPQYNEYFAGTNPKLHNVTKNGSFVNMTDSNENFSKILADTKKASFKTPNTTNFSELQAKFSEGAALKEDQEKTLIAPEHTVDIPATPNADVPSDRAILIETKAETDILRNNNKLLVEPTESAGSSRFFEPIEKYDLQNAIKSLNTRMAGFIANDGESIASGSSSTVRSAASFAITTKGEQLDITQPKGSADYVLEDVEDVVRKSSGVEDSNVNLFNMDSHSSYDSYLDLFKSKESKEFDDLRGKKSPIKHVFGMAGFAYVEELVSEDSKSDEIEDEAKPKIVDFVPLDDDTTPFFTKDNKESYDTLEREKTFHVLGQASKMSDISRDNADILKKEKDNKNENNSDNLASSLEILARNSSSFSKASSKSQTNTSRTSFSQAKKLFEALVEANKDERPKTTVTGHSPVRYDNMRDSRSMDQIRIRGSVSKEEEIPPLAETGLLSKDGDTGPLDGN